MTSIYLHRLTVTVITTEGSPDVIEKLLDEAGTAAGMRVDARTDSANRMRGPAICIAPEPAYPTGPRDHRAELIWAEDRDRWLDSWPTVATFEEQGL